MKVTLVFCLVAIYGAVAADYDSVETTAYASASSSWLQGVNDRVQGVIAAKQNAVEKGVDVLNTTVNAVSEFGATAIENGTALAQSAIDMGSNMAVEGMKVAEKIVNKTSDLVQSMPIVGKFMPTKMMKGIFSSGMSTGVKVVTGAASTSKKGVNMGGDIGKGMMGAIGMGATKVNGAVVTGDHMANAVASNAVTAAMNVMSKGIKAVGNRVSKAGSMMSASASLNAGVSASADVSTTN